MSGRCEIHDNWHAHCQQCCQEEIERLKNTIAMLEADCEDGTCRACVKCHDARERERDEARAKIVAMHKIAWPRGGDLNGDPECDLLLMVGTFQCSIRDLEAERDALKAEVDRITAEWAAVVNEKDAVLMTMGDLLMKTVARRDFNEMRAERDAARADAAMQNKACAEEILARQHMQVNWDTMVASIKQHHEAQLNAEAVSRELREFSMHHDLCKQLGVGACTCGLSNLLGKL